MKKISILAASLMCSVVLSAQTRETAVLFSGTELDESYLLADNVSIVFDNSGNTAIYSGTAKVSELDITNEVTIEFKDAFKLTANQDPDHTTNYYSTFFTTEGAYKLPEDETAKAYIGAVNRRE